MARLDINRLKRINKQRNTIHVQIIGTYTAFEIEGNKFFQIDTYGTQEREMPEKISQSFQLDYDSAKWLVNLLIDEFNLR